MRCICGHDDDGDGGCDGDDDDDDEDERRWFLSVESGKSSFDFTLEWSSRDVNITIIIIIIIYFLHIFFIFYFRKLYFRPINVRTWRVIYLILILQI